MKCKMFANWDEADNVIQFEERINDWLLENYNNTDKKIIEIKQSQSNIIEGDVPLITITIFYENEIYQI